MTQYAMVIDLKRCLGCHACTMACKVENATGPGIFWAKVADEEQGKFPHVKRWFLPKLCMQCQDPPCVDVCPTGASHQREDGIVLIEYEKCIGCGYCIVACPYGARQRNEEKQGYFGDKLTPYEEFGYEKHQVGVAEKCTFCEHRLEKGENPACVDACIASARIFGDLDDPESKVCQSINRRSAFQLREELGTDPSVYYLPE